MQRSSIILRYILILSQVFALACSSAPHRNDDSQDQELSRAASPQEAKEFEAIEQAYGAKDPDLVLKLTRAFVKKHSQSPILDQVHNYRGLSYISLKQYAYAVINFKHAAELTRTSGLRAMALYNEAYGHTELDQIEEAQNCLERIQPTYLNSTDRSKYFTLSAKVEKARKNFPSSARNTLSAIKYAAEYRDKEADPHPLSVFLEGALEKIESPQIVDRLISDFEDSPALDVVYFRAAKISESLGEKEKTHLLAAKLLSQFPESRFASRAREIRGTTTSSMAPSTNSNAPIQGLKIGVILTLSGKFGRYGYKALQGIELATQIFTPAGTTGAGTGITLVVRDDEGDPTKAVAAVEELVEKAGVAAIVGPLVSKIVEPVAEKAQDLGVPLITLTQKEVTGKDYVFNAALTPAMQIRELIRYTTEKTNLNRFAIMSPQSRFGEEYSRAFWDEIESHEKSVVGFETYPESETDFRSYVDSLVGLNATDARLREVEDLKKQKQNSNLKLSNKKMNRLFSLKPIVDFDAVFIPDEPKSLGQILPTFAYRDVEHTLFLGINTWNGSDLLSRAGTYAEGAVFVDAFFAGTSKPRAVKFISDFTATYHSEPSSLEAISYDAANILVSILREGAHSRSAVKNHVSSLKDFPGIMGNISYSAGKLTKQLAILTVKGGKIEEIAP